MPNFPGNDPFENGKCPNDNNVYFWLDHALFNESNPVPANLDSDNDGFCMRRAICTQCYVVFTDRDNLPGKFQGSVPGVGINKQVVRTQALIGQPITFKDSTGKKLSAKVTCTPETWADGMGVAKPDEMKVHLMYYVPGGYNVDVKNNSGITVGTVKQYEKEVLNVSMGYGNNQWLYIEGL